MEVFGYGYVTKTSTNILRSTVYKALRGQFIPQENISIDILECSEPRKELNDVIYRKATKGDTILILNRHTLGNTNEFRKWWKIIVLEQKLNLLIVDKEVETGIDYYSTTDYSLICYHDNQIKERWERLQKDVFERTTQQVGRQKAVITERFIRGYWAFQAYKITPEEAFSYAGVSKPTFYSLCRKYEATENYDKELALHTELHTLPKRGGLPKNIEKVFFAVEQQKKPLNIACEEANIKLISPTEYQRCLLTKQGGRKIQFDMEKEHYKKNYLKEEDLK